MTASTPLLAALRPRVADRAVVVFHQHIADHPPWRRLLTDAGARSVHSVAFDHGIAAAAVHRHRPGGAGSLLRAQHAAIADLAQPESALAQHLDTLDPRGEALLLFCDPLAPPAWGTRRLLTPRRDTWDAYEDKTRVDALWDRLGVARAPAAIVHGRDPATCHSAQTRVENTEGSVAALPTGAGGEGLWWRPPGHPHDGLPPVRLRLMPALPGIPCRLHAITTPHGTAPLPPMELVTLRRPESHTFLCCGAVPLRAGLTPAALSRLARLTGTIGRRLYEATGYVGAFAVDGVLTPDGFRPTELNPRLTSALEAVPAPLRVHAHTAALLARTGADLQVEPLARVLGFALRHPPRLRLSAVSPRAPEPGPGHTCQPGPPRRVLPGMSVETVHSPRGLRINIALAREHTPPDVALCALAPALFAHLDDILGTGLGPLLPPFGLYPARASDCAGVLSSGG